MCEILRDNEAVGTDESFARRADALLAVGGERNVCRAGVAAVEGPFGFAVSDDEDSRCCHGRGQALR